MKNLLIPGSPCLPERPRICRSILWFSILSVPITTKPPRSATPGPNLISVPRPAMDVATVTAPSWPDSAIICASRAALLAFSKL